MFRSLRRCLEVSTMNRTCRGVHLLVTPRVALYDQACAITASDLKPNSAVTFRAEVEDEKGRLFRSHAHFIANSKGNVDLTKDCSVGGSYRGLYPMGLFVGLSTLDENLRHTRLHRTNPYVPWNIKISLHEGHTKITDAVDSSYVVDVQRHVVSPGVKRIPIKQGKVRGVLYVPAGPGPHPGIVDIYGGAGGLVDHRAAMQASRGIASLSIAYFGYDDLPNNLVTVDLDLFLEAVDVLTSHPEVIPDRCGIWASCQGAIYGYTLADKSDKVKAVVTVNGSILPYGTQVLYKDEIITPPLIKLGSRHMNFDENLVGWTKLEEVKEMLDPKNNLTIKLGQGSTNARYLLISGSRCALGGPIVCKVMKDKLHQIGNDKVEHVNYENAGHILEPPYSSFNDYIYNPYWPYREGGPKIPTKGVKVGGGGTVEGNHVAMEHMWPMILNFFYRQVKTNSLWYQNWLDKSL